MDLAAAVHLEGAIGDLHELGGAYRLHGGDHVASVLDARALRGDLAEGAVALRVDGVHGHDGAARSRDRRGDLAQHTAGPAGELDAQRERELCRRSGHR
jgi:hypothetical protein